MTPYSLIYLFTYFLTFGGIAWSLKVKELGTSFFVVVDVFVLGPYSMVFRA